MGEVELHVMAQRLQASKRAAAERGQLRTPLPVGYVHDEAGEIVIDPDAEVQAAVGDLFAAFTACGSAYGVVAAFADRRFPLRAYGGAWAGQLRWGALTHARVLGVLRNPCYAGAYVHGRYSSRRRVDPDGTVHTGLVERSRAEWPVLIHDHHDGYIGWADYLANEAALAANRTNAGARPPREGSALCQGIMICGSCGKPMRTNYHTDQRPAYECSGRADRLTTPTCRSIAASTVDEAVPELLLNALNPNEIALALAARSLETRWEAKLAALAQAEHALAAARDTLPPLPERAELEKLAADLPGLWHAPTTSNKDRKRLLRTVIADITLLPEPDHGKARIGIRWHTGASDEVRVDRAVHPGTAVRSPSPAVDMVTRLGPTTGTDEMVGMLNAAGMTTGHGRPFDAKAVQWIRHAYHIPAPNPYAAGEISVADAAERLGVNIGVVYDWIKTGKLAARRGTGNRLCILWTDRVQAECRCRITESGHLNPSARHTASRTRA